jgi:hypothetical protein
MLIALVACVLAFAWASTAQAQTFCAASLKPRPDAGQNPPGDVVSPGQVIDIEVSIENECETAGAPAAATLVGTTTVELACEDQLFPIPCSDLTNNPWANVQCTPEAGVSCNVNGNEVDFTYGGGLALGAGAEVLLATIQVTAAATAPGEPNGGKFVVTAVTGPSDVMSNSSTGGGQGTAPLYYPGECDVMIERTVSCDDGGLFEEFCARDPAVDPDVRVKYKVTNTGVNTSLVCTVTDSNSFLGEVAGSGDLGAQSKDVDVDIDGMFMFDIVAGCDLGPANDPQADDEEPATATVQCLCGQVDVMDTDGARFLCIPPVGDEVTVPTTSDTGFMLIVAGLLASMTGLWLYRRRASDGRLG